LLIHAVKPKSDVTANITAVAKTPIHISEPRNFREDLYDGLHRILLVMVKVCLSGAGHEGAGCRRSGTFAAFIPHWGEWSASLSGGCIHLINPPPMEKGVGGP
jgi:hypothetical protein